MWRLLSASVLLALAMATYNLTARRAYACSVGPDFDPVASADVIVEGRFLNYEELPHPGQSGGTVPIRVNMTVIRVFKGDVVPGAFQIFDDRTLNIGGNDERYWGGGGSCGAFSEDPTGRYGIIGLTRLPDGRYQSSLPLWFFSGTGPEDEPYAQALERMRSFPGASVLPSLGSRSAEAERGWMALAAGGFAVFGIVLLGTATLLVRARSGS